MAPFVGLTGGLGAGKSEALRMLGELGAATLSTDAVVHELLGHARAARSRGASVWARRWCATAGSTGRRSPSACSATTRRAPGSRACSGRAWARAWPLGAAELR